MPAPQTAVVIPARYASTRFPGKPLVNATGKFLIQHVVEQARKSALAELIVVATDDDRIAEAVRSFGGVAVMTSADHVSGTDRIAEVAQLPEFAHVTTLVNVQGDEPEIDPGLIDHLIRAAQSPGIAMATAASPFTSSQDVLNPNQVKVVLDQQQNALYFSRSVIPHDRDGGSVAGMGGKGGVGGQGLYLKHLGIYAYRREALLRLAGTPPCGIEQVEKLEQLRALYLGIRIHVHVTMHVAAGIDTPEDYAAFVGRVKGG